MKKPSSRIFAYSIIFPILFTLNFGQTIAQDAAQTTKPIVYPPMQVTTSYPIYNLGDIFYSRAQAAEHSLKNGNATLKSVVDLYQLSVQHGKNQSYLALGNLYARNNDNLNALENYKKAAELNIYGANYQTAILINKMNPDNCAEALPYLDRAIEDKSPSAPRIGTKWYIEKTCGANNDAKALELALQTASVFYYENLNYISRAYYEGIGTPKDLPKAWAYLTIASNMAKSDTAWVKHDPQYAIDTLAVLDAALRRTPTEYAKAQTELDELCKANYLCPLKLVDKLKNDGRTLARSVAYAPAPPAPYPSMPRANAPEGYKNFSDLSTTDSVKYRDLGNLYSIAINFERDYLKTNPRPIDKNLLIEKYLIPAEAGHANAMYRLSGLYQDIRDMDKMREWLKKAADAGNSTAQLKYGQLSLSPLNCNDAKKYLGFAQFNNSLQANMALGELYNSTRCGPPDYSKAFKANVIAARYSHLPAQIALADAFFGAKGTSQNLIMAVAWGKIAWYNAPSRGIFAPSDQRKVFDRSKSIEKTLLPATQTEIKNAINEICLFQTACKNISNEDLIRLQSPEN